MKLLIITQKVDQNDPILGFFHRWLVEFSKVYEKVTVICLQEGPHSLPSNVSVYSLGKEQNLGRISYLIRFYSLIWKQRAEYDKVFVHMNPVYIILAGFLWRAWGKKIALWYTHKLVDTKLLIALFLTNVVFTASIESFRAKSPKVHVMGHGIDTELFAPATKAGVRSAEQPVEKRPFTIISVGRVSLAKNQKLLVDIARVLVATTPDFVIEIVGGPVTAIDREYDKELRAFIGASGLSEHFHCLGAKSQQELIPILQKVDVLVNLSDTGSLDKVVLEAMSMAKIPVTCNEAFETLLRPRGLFVDKADIDGFAELLHTLAVKTEAERRAVGAELRGYIMEHHDLGNLIRRIANTL
ncbi:MAG: glycosyltransferase family 4 protein [bacterium]